jgi:uncharacterized membrane protein
MIETLIQIGIAVFSLLILLGITVLFVDDDYEE